MDDCEECKPSVERVMLQVWWEEHSQNQQWSLKMCLSCWNLRLDRTWTDEARLPMDEQAKRFPEMETMVKMRWRREEGLKALDQPGCWGSRLERTDFNFERSPNVGRMLSSSIFYAAERSFRKGRVNRLVLRNRHSHPNLQNSLISQQPPTWRQDFPPAKRLHLPEGPPHWTSRSAFSAIRYFKIRYTFVFKDITLPHT